MLIVAGETLFAVRRSLFARRGDVSFRVSRMPDSYIGRPRTNRRGYKLLAKSEGRTAKSDDCHERFGKLFCEP